MLQPAACGRYRRNADGAERRGYSSLFGLRHYFVIRHSSFVIFDIMTSAQIRQSFLDFFREKKHTIVSSSSLLPDAPNLLFTNAGMNQFVPIFLGQQKPPWNPPRVADTQKCIRAGGKHNDLEDVGLDTYHHTFFEMLGNWSFGDYFKREAIEWAWELVVERWGLPPQRLYATVYKPGPNEPSEFDQEAHDHWARLFQDADLDPKIHVLTAGKADNFWMMGDTGPCGPCSELHVDLTPDGDTRGALVNKDDPRCFEIWNLVFIQFNANPDGTFSPLPQRHVDTGMGFERVTAIIQGTKKFSDFSGTISNYETDIFRPIFDELEKLSGKKYTSTLPGRQASSLSGQTGVSPVGSDDRQDARLPGQTGRLSSEQEKIDIAFRVIADHIRTLSFAIGDGIIPSNEGRGYVLRRILRRAVSYGRDLEIHVPFLFLISDVIVRTMSDVFPELGTLRDRIKDAIKKEEELFSKTIDQGLRLLRDIVRRKTSTLLSAVTQPGSVPLSDRVELSNTDPLNRAMIATLSPETNSLAKLVNALKGKIDFPEHPLGGSNVWLRVEGSPELSVEKISEIKTISGSEAFKLYDTYGFPLDLTQVKARELGMTVDAAGFTTLMEEQRTRARAAQKRETITVSSFATVWPTQFVGYEHDETNARVIDSFLLEGGGAVVVDKTPLYVEMGGQVGDTGEISDGQQTWRITDVRKANLATLHMLGDKELPVVGSEVQVSIDHDRRRAIERHHTVTHLLHWALHEVVSRDAAQKGSYVGPDKLTFDFSSAALTLQQKRDVEKLVNEKIAENAPVSWTEIPYAEARKRKDIIQFFGEKYGDTVRVLQIGGDPKKLNGYSMELCGGTHVRSTSEIGPFRIVKEEAIAAGIRRIEAVAGDGARAWAKQEAARQQEKFEILVRKKPDIDPLPAFQSEAETPEMLKQIDARAAQLEKLDGEVRQWEKQNAKAAGAEMQSRAATIANEIASSCTGKDFCVTEVPNADGKLLGAVADALKTKFNAPIFLAGAIDGRVALIASVPKEMTSKFQANKIIQEIAPIVGGKGGGRPENAQGAGTDASKINQALDRAKKIFIG